MAVAASGSRRAVTFDVAARLVSIWRPRPIKPLDKYQSIWLQTKQVFDKVVRMISCGEVSLAWIDPRELDVPALHEQARTLRAGICRLQAAEAASVGEISRRGSYRADAAKDAKSWMRQSPLVSSREARTAVKAAEVFGLLPELVELAASGELGLEHVALLAPIAATTNGREAFRERGSSLLAAAYRESPEDFVKSVEQFLFAGDTDGSEDRADRIRGNRRVTFRPGGDGSSAMVVSGPVDDVAWIRAAIELAANRSWCSAHPERNRRREADPEPFSQRLFDGLVDICREFMRAGGAVTGSSGKGGNGSSDAATDLVDDDTGIAIGIASNTVDDADTRDTDGDHGTNTEDGVGMSADVDVKSVDDEDVDHAGPPASAPGATPNPTRFSAGLAVGNNRSRRRSADEAKAAWANRRLAPAIVGIVDFRQWPPACSIDGQPTTLSNLERLSCESAVYRLVLDAQSVPLDLGTTSRFASSAQYVAMLAVDQHCCAPHCDTPGRWCIAHHCVPYPKGATSWRNMVLLCDRHHHLVHAGRWSVERDPANPSLVRWFDPSGSPRPPPL